jgi:hypothetical protein
VKKLVILAAAAAMGLWGCSHSSMARADAADAEQPTNEVETARQDRMDAPTVYDGEAVGGAGHSVTTPEGQTWTPESQPGNTVVNNPSDDNASGQSEVIDEGKSDDAAEK